MARVVDVSPQKYFEKFEDGALIVGEGLARFQRLQAATFGTNDDLFPVLSALQPVVTWNA